MGLPHGCRSRQIFGGAKEFCRISLNLPEKCLGRLLCEYFLLKTVCGKTSKKMALHVMLGTIFFKSKHVGHHLCLYFQRLCPAFQGFCEGEGFKGFNRFCPNLWDFARIFTKKKLSGVRLRLLNPCPRLP